MEAIQENGAIINNDYNALLEDIEKCDDLEVLDEIERMMLSENQNMVQTISRIVQQNVELKDEINAAKCFITELDQLHNDELEKIENIRENIRLKQLEVKQEQNQQVDDLDQFEAQVDEITKKFVTAPTDYEVNHVKEKIDGLKTVLEEKKGMLEQEKKHMTLIEKKVETPKSSMDVPLKTFDHAISATESCNIDLTKSLKKESNEIDKMRFNMKTSAITKLNLSSTY